MKKLVIFGTLIALAMVCIAAPMQTTQSLFDRVANLEVAMWGGALIGGGAPAFASISTTGALTSTKASGAPIVVASTAPATLLNAYSVAYNAAGTQQATAHHVYGTCVLGTSCAVTFSGSAAFTSSGSYVCTATDQTAAAAVKVVNTSASVATFTGTGTDTLAFHCIGN